MTRFLLLAACLLASPGALAQQRTFSSAEDGAQALVAAVKAGSQKDLLAVLGAKAKAAVASDDAATGRTLRERFVKAHEEESKLERTGDDHALLVVGKDAWPFPFPLVRNAGRWRFDTAAGLEEIVNRRIGRNELSAVEAAHAYGDAQREYYLRNPQNDKLLHYAQRFRSSEGKRDGLYYPTKAGEPPSPLGLLYQGPYHGYRFRILKAQGPAARGGAYNYMAQGRMIGGFALVAYPASYGSSGVTTFLVSHAGVVYEKDLGRESAAVAEKMTRFNPDKTWKEVR